MSQVYDSRSRAFAERYGKRCAAVSWTPLQGVAALVVLGGTISALVIWPVATWAICSYAAAVFFSLWMVLRLGCAWLSWLANPQIRVTQEQLAALADDELPIYSILVPLYREPEVVDQLLAAMRALDYPREKLDLQFLLEPDDAVTRAALDCAGLDDWMRITLAPAGAPRTKPRVCNTALDRATGAFLVIYDAEDRPEPDQLKKAIIAYRAVEDRVVCLQCRLVHYNARQSIASRWAAIDYLAWFGWFLPGLQRLGGALPLGGTSNHFRTSVLRSLDGWDPFNVTEDADLGIRLGRHGYRTGMLDSVTWEEAVTRLPAWIAQRSRWFKGYLQTWLVHQRGGALRELGLWQYLLMQMFLLGTLISLLAAPVFWTVIVLWLGIGWSLVDIHNVWSRIGLALSIALLVANGVWVALNVLACTAARRWDLVPAALFSPLAWILHSAAAWRGALQFLVKPFHWEKTQHGSGVEDVRGGRRGLFAVLALALLCLGVWQLVGLVGQRIEEDWQRQVPLTARQQDLPCPVAVTPLSGVLALPLAEQRPSDALPTEHGWRVSLQAGADTTVPLPWQHDLHARRSLQCDVFLPAEAPQGMRMTMRIQDAGHRWYTWLHEQYLIPGRWTRVAFPLGLADDWRPQGHELPWHRSCLRRAQAVDLQVHGAPDWTGEGVLARFRGDVLQAVGGVGEASWSLRPEAPTAVRVGELCELRWRAADWPDGFRARAVLTGPDGEQTRETFLAPEVIDGQVASEPILRVRHRFAVAGDWQVRLQLSDPALVSPPSTTVSVAAGSAASTWRPDREQAGLWRDASGRLVIAQQAHGDLADPLRPLDEERLQRAADLGVDYLRLWMTPWGDGLEAPGGWGQAGGVGVFDPVAAQGLDRQFDRAAELGLRVVLCVEPFLWSPEAAWPVHPYNRLHGGPLTGPVPWSADPAAREAVLNKYRYALARWGHHPAIVAWELHGLADATASVDPDFRAILAELIRAADPLGRPVIESYAGLASDHDFAIHADEETVPAAWLLPKQKDLSLDASGDQRVAIVSVTRPYRDLQLKATHDNLSRAAAIALRLYLPPTAAVGAKALLVAQDRDDRWWQYEIPADLPVGRWAELRLPLVADAGWRGIGHERPFQAYDVHHLRLLALRLVPSPGTDLTALLTEPRVVPIADEAMRFISFTAGPDEVATHTLWEARGELNRWHANPFDPEDVRLWMDVTRPDGSRHRIDGFVHQDFRRELIDDRERLTPVGPLSWRFRYAASSPGAYRYRIGGRDRQGELLAGPSGRFHARLAETGLAARGYVHRDPRKPRYLSYADGGLYWPIGQNICQPVDLQQPYRYDFDVPPDQRTYTYDRFLSRMAANDMTWGRIWMTPWNLGLEGPARWHDYHGLGDYNLANAWRLDHVLGVARERGIHLNLTVMHKSEVPRSMRKERHRTQWSNCVYAQHNGGPLLRGTDFFTHPAIMKAFKNRLRYMVARWGWDPAVCAWELFGETNLMPGFDPAITASWHRELTRHVKELDQDRHPVFTHCHNWQKGHELWALDEIDCVQGNGYIRPPNKTPDHVVNFRRYLDEVRQYDKPVLVAEFGGRSELGAPSRDYLEAQLHSGIWASVMADFAGSAMQWWWNFTDGIDGYRHYKPLAAFVADMDRLAEDYEQVAPTVQAESPLRCVGMRSDTALYAWVYHPEIFVSFADLPVIDAVSLPLPIKHAGVYVYEIIDPLTGRTLAQGERRIEPGERFDLPPVHRDLAFKLRFKP